MTAGRKGVSLRMPGPDGIVEDDSILETKLMTAHQVMNCHCSVLLIAEEGLEIVELLFSGVEWGIQRGIVQCHRGVMHVSIPGQSLNWKNLAASCQGRSADLGQGQVGDGRGGRGGQRECTMPAGSRCLDKLVNCGGPRGVDNLEKKNEHHSLEKRGGVRKGCQVFGLVEQVGVSL